MNLVLIWRVKPDVIVCCCSQSDSRLDASGVQKRSSAYPRYKEWLFELLLHYISLNQPGHFYSLSNLINKIIISTELSLNGIISFSDYPLETLQMVLYENTSISAAFQNTQTHPFLAPMTCLVQCHKNISFPH